MSENSSQSQFNAYEYIGVIAPGSVFCLGVMFLWPETKATIFNQDITIGEFGLFIIVAFVVGHLIQSIGNVIENILWRCFGGMPTCWVLQSKQTLLSFNQLKTLEKITLHNHGEFTLLKNISSTEWVPVVREMYVQLLKAGRTGRIDAFNRNYGLLRGIASSFILIALLIVIKDFHDYMVSIIILIFGAIPSLYRMYRFGRNYGRELLIEYINLEKEKIL